MEKIIIEERQTKIEGLLMVTFLLLLVSLGMWIFGLKEKKVLLWVAGVLTSIFFSVGFLILVGRALQKKPLITITFDGIIDSSLGGSVGYIPFLDIEEFCIFNMDQCRVIGIIPKDMDSFISKLSPVKQRIASTNIKMNYPPFSIRVDKAKDMSLEDIYTLLKKRLEDYSCLYD